MHDTQNAIVVPTRLRDRPLYAGFPVPYLVMWADGKPDFRVTDMERWHEVVDNRLCSLCGQPNDYWLWFIGGDVSISETRLFFDPPTHQECAEYALRVCPYLATGRDRNYRPVEMDHAKVQTKDNVSVIAKPERFGLARTRTYKKVRQEGQWLLEAAPWVSVSWWREGKQIEA